jgi:hypothetical protein
VVEATIYEHDGSLRETQFAVFSGPANVPGPILVSEAANYEDATLVLEATKGDCWIGKRDVITHSWTPVDTDDPKW